MSADTSTQIRQQPLSVLQMQNGRPIVGQNSDDFSAFGVLQAQDTAYRSASQGGIQDVVLRNKLLGYIEKFKDVAGMAGFYKASHAFIMQGTSSIANTSDHFNVQQLLKLVTDPSISSTLNFSADQLFHLNNLEKDCKKCGTAEAYSTAKTIRNSVIKDLGISKTELKFRRHAQLINPDHPAFKGILDTIFTHSLVGLSDTEIAEQVLSYVQNNFSYQADIGADSWKSIDETLLHGGGDCEDLSVLTSSLLMAALGQAGHSETAVRDMVTLSAGYINNDIGHVLVKLKTDTGVFLLDSTGKVPILREGDIKFDEVFEMNDENFTKYQDITHSFETAVQITSADIVGRQYQSGGAGIATLTARAAFTDVSESFDRTTNIIDQINYLVLNLEDQINKARDIPFIRQGKQAQSTTLYRKYVDSTGSLDPSSVRDIEVAYNAAIAAATAGGSTTFYNELNGNFNEFSINAGNVSDFVLLKEKNAFLQRGNKSNLEGSYDDNYRMYFVDDGNGGYRQIRDRAEFDALSDSETIFRRLNVYTSVNLDSISVNEYNNTINDPVLSSSNTVEKFDFYSVKKVEITLGTGRGQFDMHVVDFNAEAMENYMTDVLEGINHITLLMQTSMLLLEKMIIQAVEVDDPDQNEKNNRTTILDDPAYKSFSNSASKWQSKISSSVQQVSDRIFEFINTTNDMEAQRVGFAIDMWPRNPSTQGGVDGGEILGNVILGMFSNLVDDWTGVISFEKAGAKFDLAKLKTSVTTRNTTLRLDITRRLMEQRLNIWDVSTDSNGNVQDDGAPNNLNDPDRLHYLEYGKSQASQTANATILNLQSLNAQTAQSEANAGRVTRGYLTNAIGSLSGEIDGIVSLIRNAGNQSTDIGLKNLTYATDYFGTFNGLAREENVQNAGDSIKYASFINMAPEQKNAPPSSQPTVAQPPQQAVNMNEIIELNNLRLEREQVDATIAQGVANGIPAANQVAEQAERTRIQTEIEDLLDIPDTRQQISELVTLQQNIINGNQAEAYPGHLTQLNTQITDLQAGLANLEQQALDPYDPNAAAAVSEIGAASAQADADAAAAVPAFDTPAPMGGSDRSFLDFNTPRKLDLQTSITQYTNFLKTVINLRMVLLRATYDVAKELGTYGTSPSSGNLEKLVNQSVDAELGLQSSYMQSALDESTKLVSAANELIRSRFDYWNKSAEMGLKIAKTTAYAVIEGIAIGFGLGLSAVSTILGLTPEHFSYVMNTTGTATLDAAASLAMVGINEVTVEKEYYRPHVSQSAINEFNFSGAQVQQNVLDQDFQNSGINTLEAFDRGQTEVRDYLQYDLQRQLLQGRKLFGKVANNRTFYNATDSYPDSTPEFVTSRGDGYYVKDSYAAFLRSGPGSFDDAALMSSNLLQGVGDFNQDPLWKEFAAIKIRLIAIQMLWDAIFEVAKNITDSPSKHAANYSKLSGQVKAYISLEENIARSLLAESDVIVQAANQSADREKQNIEAIAESVTNSAKAIGSLVVALPREPGNRLAYFGITQAIEQADLLRRKVLGPYAGMTAVYRNPANAANLKNLGGGGANTDNPEAPYLAADILPDVFDLDQFQVPFDANNDGVISQNETSINRTQLLSTFQSELESVEDTSDLRRFTPYGDTELTGFTQMQKYDVQERKLFNDFYQSSQNNPFRIASGMPMTSVDFGLAIETKQEMTGVAMGRNLMMTIMNSYTVQRNNVLREMFGTASTSSPFQKGMDIVDSYNSTQDQAFDTLVEEFKARSEANNIYQGELIGYTSELSVSTAALIAFTVAYKLYPSPPDGGETKRSNWLKRQVIVTVTRAIAQFISTLTLALLALTTERNTPKVHSNFDISAQTEASEESQAERDEKARVAELKEKKNSGKELSDAEKTELGQLEGNIERRNRVNEANAQAERAAASERANTETTDYGINSGSIRFTGAGTTVNTALKTRAQLQVNRKSRQMQVVLEAKSQLFEEMQNTSLAQTGLEGTNATAGVTGLLNIAKRAQMFAVESIFAAVQALAQVRGEALERLVTGLVKIFSEFIKLGVSVAQQNIKEKKDAKKVDKLSKLKGQSSEKLKATTAQAKEAKQQSKKEVKDKKRLVASSKSEKNKSPEAKALQKDREGKLKKAKKAHKENKKAVKEAKANQNLFKLVDKSTEIQKKNAVNIGKQIDKADAAESAAYKAIDEAEENGASKKEKEKLEKKAASASQKSKLLRKAEHSADDSLQLASNIYLDRGVGGSASAVAAEAITSFSPEDNRMSQTEFGLKVLDYLSGMLSLSLAQAFTSVTVSSMAEDSGETEAGADAQELTSFDVEGNAENVIERMTSDDSFQDSGRFETADIENAILSAQFASGNFKSLAKNMKAQDLLLKILSNYVKDLTRYTIKSIAGLNDEQLKKKREEIEDATTEAAIKAKEDKLQRGDLSPLSLDDLAKHYNGRTISIFGFNPINVARRAARDNTRMAKLGLGVKSFFFGNGKKLEDVGSDAKEDQEQSNNKKILSLIEEIKKDPTKKDADLTLDGLTAREGTLKGKEKDLLKKLRMKEDRSFSKFGRGFRRLWLTTKRNGLFGSIPLLNGRLSLFGLTSGIQILPNFLMAVRISNDEQKQAMSERNDEMKQHFAIENMISAQGGAMKRERARLINLSRSVDSQSSEVAERTMEDAKGNLQWLTNDYLLSVRRNMIHAQGQTSVVQTSSSLRSLLNNDNEAFNTLLKLNGVSQEFSSQQVASKKKQKAGDGDQLRFAPQTPEDLAKIEAFFTDQIDASSDKSTKEMLSNTLTAIQARFKSKSGSGAPEAVTMKMNALGSDLDALYQMGKFDKDTLKGFLKNRLGADISDTEIDDISNTLIKQLKKANFIEFKHGKYNFTDAFYERRDGLEAGGEDPLSKIVSESLGSASKDKTSKVIRLIQQLAGATSAFKDVSSSATDLQFAAQDVVDNISRELAKGSSSELDKLFQNFKERSDELKERLKKEEDDRRAERDAQLGEAAVVLQGTRILSINKVNDTFDASLTTISDVKEDSRSILIPVQNGNEIIYVSVSLSNIGSSAEILNAVRANLNEDPSKPLHFIGKSDTERGKVKLTLENLNALSGISPEKAVKIHDELVSAGVIDDEGNFILGNSDAINSLIFDEDEAINKSIQQQVQGLGLDAVQGNRFLDFFDDFAAQQSKRQQLVAELLQVTQLSQTLTKDNAAKKLASLDSELAIFDFFSRINVAGNAQDEFKLYIDGAIRERIVRSKPSLGEFDNFEIKQEVNAQLDLLREKGILAADGYLTQAALDDDLSKVDLEGIQLNPGLFFEIIQRQKEKQGRLDDIQKRGGLNSRQYDRMRKLQHSGDDVLQAIDSLPASIIEGTPDLQAARKGIEALKTELQNANDVRQETAEARLSHYNSLYQRAPFYSLADAKRNANGGKSIAGIFSALGPTLSGPISLFPGSGVVTAPLGLLGKGIGYLYNNSLGKVFDNDRLAVNLSLFNSPEERRILKTARRQDKLGISGARMTEALQSFDLVSQKSEVNAITSNIVSAYTSKQLGNSDEYSFGKKELEETTQAAIRIGRLMIVEGRSPEEAASFLLDAAKSVAKGTQNKDLGTRFAALTLRIMNQHYPEEAVAIISALPKIVAQTEDRSLGTEIVSKFLSTDTDFLENVKDYSNGLFQRMPFFGNLFRIGKIDVNPADRAAEIKNIRGIASAKEQAEAATEALLKSDNLALFISNIRTKDQSTSPVLLSLLSSEAGLKSVLNRLGDDLKSGTDSGKLQVEKALRNIIRLNGGATLLGKAIDSGEVLESGLVATALKKIKDNNTFLRDQILQAASLTPSKFGASSQENLFTESPESLSSRTIEKNLNEFITKVELDGNGTISTLQDEGNLIALVNIIENATRIGGNSSALARRALIKLDAAINTSRKGIAKDALKKREESAVDSISVNTIARVLNKVIEESGSELLQGKDRKSFQNQRRELSFFTTESASDLSSDILSREFELLQSAQGLRESASNSRELDTLLSSDEGKDDLARLLRESTDIEQTLSNLAQAAAAALATRTLNAEPGSQLRQVGQRIIAVVTDQLLATTQDRAVLRNRLQLFSTALIQNVDEFNIHLAENKQIDLKKTLHEILTVQNPDSPEVQKFLMQAQFMQLPEQALNFQMDDSGLWIADALFKNSVLVKDPTQLQDMYRRLAHDPDKRSQAAALIYTTLLVPPKGVNNHIEQVEALASSITSGITELSSAEDIQNTVAFMQVLTASLKHILKGESPTAEASFLALDTATPGSADEVKQGMQRIIKEMETQTLLMSRLSGKPRRYDTPKATSPGGRLSQATFRALSVGGGTQKPEDTMKNLKDVLSQSMADMTFSHESETTVETLKKSLKGLIDRIKNGGSEEPAGFKIVEAQFKAALPNLTVSEQQHIALLLLTAKASQYSGADSELYFKEAAAELMKGQTEQMSQTQVSLMLKLTSKGAGTEDIRLSMFKEMFKTGRLDNEFMERAKVVSEFEPETATEKENLQAISDIILSRMQSTYTGPLANANAQALINKGVLSENSKEVRAPGNLEDLNDAIEVAKGSATDAEKDTLETIKKMATDAFNMEYDVKPDLRDGVVQTLLKKEAQYLSQTMSSTPDFSKKQAQNAAMATFVVHVSNAHQNGVTFKLDDASKLSLSFFLSGQSNDISDPAMASKLQRLSRTIKDETTLDGLSKAMASVLPQLPENVQDAFKLLSASLEARKSHADLLSKLKGKTVDEISSGTTKDALQELFNNSREMAGLRDSDPALYLTLLKVAIKDPTISLNGRMSEESETLATAEFHDIFDLFETATEKNSGDVRKQFLELAPAASEAPFNHKIILYELMRLNKTQFEKVFQPSTKNLATDYSFSDLGEGIDVNDVQSLLKTPFTDSATGEREVLRDESGQLQPGILNDTGRVRAEYLNLDGTVNETYLRNTLSKQILHTRIVSPPNSPQALSDKITDKIKSAHQNEANFRTGLSDFQKEILESPHISGASEKQLLKELHTNIQKSHARDRSGFSELKRETTATLKAYNENNTEQVQIHLNRAMATLQSMIPNLLAMGVDKATLKEIEENLNLGQTDGNKLFKLLEQIEKLEGQNALSDTDKKILSKARADISTVTLQRLVREESFRKTHTDDISKFLNSLSTLGDEIKMDDGTTVRGRGNPVHTLMQSGTFTNTDMKVFMHLFDQVSDKSKRDNLFEALLESSGIFNPKDEAQMAMLIDMMNEYSGGAGKVLEFVSDPEQQGKVIELLMQQGEKINYSATASIFENLTQIDEGLATLSATDGAEKILPHFKLLNEVLRPGVSTDDRQEILQHIASRLADNTKLFLSFIDFVENSRATLNLDINMDTIKNPALVATRDLAASRLTSTRLTPVNKMKEISNFQRILDKDPAAGIAALETAIKSMDTTPPLGEVPLAIDIIQESLALPQYRSKILGMIDSDPEIAETMKEIIFADTDSKWLNDKTVETLVQNSGTRFLRAILYDKERMGTFLEKANAGTNPKLRPDLVYLAIRDRKTRPGSFQVPRNLTDVQIEYALNRSIKEGNADVFSTVLTGPRYQQIVIDHLTRALSSPSSATTIKPKEIVSFLNQLNNPRVTKQVLSAAFKTRTDGVSAEDLPKELEDFFSETLADPNFMSQMTPRKRELFLSDTFSNLIKSVPQANLPALSNGLKGLVDRNTQNGKARVAKTAFANLSETSRSDSGITKENSELIYAHLRQRGIIDADGFLTELYSADVTLVNVLPASLKPENPETLQVIADHINATLQSLDLSRTRPLPYPVDALINAELIKSQNSDGMSPDAIFKGLTQLPDALTDYTQVAAQLSREFTNPLIRQNFAKFIAQANMRHHAEKLLADPTLQAQIITLDSSEPVISTLLSNPGLATGLPVLSTHLTDLKTELDLNKISVSITSPTADGTLTQVELGKKINNGTIYTDDNARQQLLMILSTTKPTDPLYLVIRDRKVMEKLFANVNSTAQTRLQHQIVAHMATEFRQNPPKTVKEALDQFSWISKHGNAFQVTPAALLKSPDKDSQVSIGIQAAETLVGLLKSMGTLDENGNINVLLTAEKTLEIEKNLKAEHVDSPTISHILNVLSSSENSPFAAQSRAMMMKIEPTLNADRKAVEKYASDIFKSDISSSEKQRLLQPIIKFFHAKRSRTKLLGSTTLGESWLGSTVSWLTKKHQQWEAGTFALVQHKREPLNTIPSYQDVDILEQLHKDIKTDADREVFVELLATSMQTHGGLYVKRFEQAMDKPAKLLQEIVLNDIRKHGGRLVDMLRDRIQPDKVGGSDTPLKALDELLKDQWQFSVTAQQGSAEKWVRDKQGNKLYGRDAVVASFKASINDVISRADFQPAKLDAIIAKLPEMGLQNQDVSWIHEMILERSTFSESQLSNDLLKFNNKEENKTVPTAEILDRLTKADNGFIVRLETGELVRSGKKIKSISDLKLDNLLSDFEPSEQEKIKEALLIRLKQPHALMESVLRVSNQDLADFSKNEGLFRRKHHVYPLVFNRRALYVDGATRRNPGISAGDAFFREESTMDSFMKARGDAGKHVMQMAEHFLDAGKQEYTHLHKMDHFSSGILTSPAQDVAEKLLRHRPLVTPKHLLSLPDIHSVFKDTQEKGTLGKNVTLDSFLNKLHADMKQVGILDESGAISSEYLTNPDKVLTALPDALVPFKAALSMLLMNIHENGKEFEAYQSNIWSSLITPNAAEHLETLNSSRSNWFSSGGLNTRADAFLNKSKDFRKTYKAANVALELMHEASRLETAIKLQEKVPSAGTPEQLASLKERQKAVKGNLLALHQNSRAIFNYVLNSGTETSMFREKNRLAPSEKDKVTQLLFGQDSDVMEVIEQMQDQIMLSAQKEKIGSLSRSPEKTRFARSLLEMTSATGGRSKAQAFNILAAATLQVGSRREFQGLASTLGDGLIEAAKQAKVDNVFDFLVSELDAKTPEARGQVRDAIQLLKLDEKAKGIITKQEMNQLFKNLAGQHSLESSEMKHLFENDDDILKLEPEERDAAIEAKVKKIQEKLAQEGLAREESGEYYNALSRDDKWQKLIDELSDSDGITEENINAMKEQYEAQIKKNQAAINQIAAFAQKDATFTMSEAEDFVTTFLQEASGGVTLNPDTVKNVTQDVLLKLFLKGDVTQSRDAFDALLHYNPQEGVDGVLNLGKSLSSEDKKVFETRLRELSGVATMSSDILFDTDTDVREAMKTVFTEHAANPSAESFHDFIHNLEIAARKEKKFNVPK